MRLLGIAFRHSALLHLAFLFIGRSSVCDELRGAALEVRLRGGSNLLGIAECPKKYVEARRIAVRRSACG